MIYDYNHGRYSRSWSRGSLSRVRGIGLGCCFFSPFLCCVVDGFIIHSYFHVNELKLSHVEVSIMDDLISYLSAHKDKKYIAELIKDANELRELYYGRRYYEMHLHIAALTRKYPLEAGMWNSVNTNMPADEHEAFRNAEAFLRSVAELWLMKVRLQEKGSERI